MNSKRYECNVLLDGIGIDGEKKLCKSSALIIGLGGVGSYTAIELAGMGVNLGLCDFDVVELKNLNRQLLYAEGDVGALKTDSCKKRIAERNSSIAIEKYNKIDGAEFGKFQVVVDCTDNIKSRMKISKLCMETGVPLVYASAVGYTARVAVFGKNYMHKTAIIGDDEQDCTSLGIFPPTAAVAGSFAASETVKIILGKYDKKNKMIVVDVFKNKFRELEI